MITGIRKYKLLTTAERACRRWRGKDKFLV